MKENLQSLRQDLEDDLRSKLQALQNSIEAEQSEENKEEEDDTEKDPLIIITENNELNLIDQGMEHVVKLEQEKLCKQGFKALFPAFFRDR